MKKPLETSRNFQVERLSKGSTSWILCRRSNQIFRLLSSRRRQMMVMQCNSKCSQNNEVGIHLDLKNAFHPTVDCSIVPTETQTRCNSLYQGEAQRAQSLKNFSYGEKHFQMEQKIWLQCMVVIDKPDFNCFQHKIWKFACFSDLICWKSEYKQSLLPNDLKWIQLYFRHCKQLHILWRDKYSYQCLQLWFYTPIYIYIHNII